MRNLNHSWPHGTRGNANISLMPRLSESERPRGKRESLIKNLRAWEQGYVKMKFMDFDERYT